MPITSGRYIHILTSSFTAIAEHIPSERRIVSPSEKGIRPVERRWNECRRKRKERLPEKKKQKKNLVSYFIPLPPYFFRFSSYTLDDKDLFNKREREKERKRETDRRGNETGLENSLDQNKCFQLFDLV